MAVLPPTTWTVVAWRTIFGLPVNWNAESTVWTLRTVWELQQPSIRVNAAKEPPGTLTVSAANWAVEPSLTPTAPTEQVLVIVKPDTPGTPTPSPARLPAFDDHLSKGWSYFLHSTYSICCQDVNNWRSWMFPIMAVRCPCGTTLISIIWLYCRYSERHILHWRGWQQPPSTSEVSRIHIKYRWTFDGKQVLFQQAFQSPTQRWGTTVGYRAI